MFKSSFTHFTIKNDSQVIIEKIKSALESDVRCKSLRATPGVLTGYVKINQETEVNTLTSEFVTKYTECKKEDIVFSGPIPLRPYSLPDDKIRLQKVQKIAVPTGAGYGSGVIGVLGYNIQAVTPEIFQTAILSAILPAVAAFLIKLQEVVKE